MPRDHPEGPLDTAKSVTAATPALALDESALVSFLRSHVSSFPAKTEDDVVGKLRVLKFTHGQSNPTYLLQAGPSWRAVLRKKPPGVTLPSAHAVEREAELLLGLAEEAESSPTSSTSLGGSGGVPVPRVLAVERGPETLGTPFYVMDFVAGRVFADPALPGRGIAASERTRLYEAAARALAGVHSVDVAASPRLSAVLLRRGGRSPSGASSSGSGSGYCARQIARWERQYLSQAGPKGNSSNSSSGGGERGKYRPLLPEMLELIAWLKAHAPSSSASSRRGDDDGAEEVPTLVHGDFRIDNLVFDYSSPKVLAVLDWELATVGDPIADVAYACLPYHLPPGVPALPSLRKSPTPSSSASLPPGVPTEEEFVEMYFAAREDLRRGTKRKNNPPLRRPTRGEWAFYVALALFRAAAILAGVGARAAGGNAASAEAAAAGDLSVVSALARRALDVVDEASSAAAPSSAPSPPPPPRGLEPSPEAAALLSELKKFMREKIFPHEAIANAHFSSPQRWDPIPGLEELKEAAKRRGLWNLWLPRELAERVRETLRRGGGGGGTERDGFDSSSPSSSSPSSLWGPGLTNLDYSFLAEEMGSVPWCPEVFNCSAPDTGNMEVLARCGDAAQQRLHLLPLLRGDARSCFAMTEPAVASSDATNMEATIAFHGDEKIVLNGRKWWTSGALDRRCRLCLFMGKDVDGGRRRRRRGGDADGGGGGDGGDGAAAETEKRPRHRRHSIVLVPMPTPGLTVRRALSVFGFDDAPHGHAEVEFSDVTLPLSSKTKKSDTADAGGGGASDDGEQKKKISCSPVVLGRGRGFEIAQARLGPGRLHHCMRLVGAGERALRLAAARARARTAFGGRALADLGGFRADLARARVELDGARLLVLHAADALDKARGDARSVRGALAAAKVAAPRAAAAALDLAVQVHGGAGVSQDTPLAALWAGARTLRLADGPDEVHLGTIAALELRRSAEREREGEGEGEVEAVEKRDRAKL